MNNYFEKVQEIAETLGWNVNIQDNIAIFQRYSGCGQDFNIELDIVEYAVGGNFKPLVYCKSLIAAKRWAAMEVN